MLRITERIDKIWLEFTNLEECSKFGLTDRRFVGKTVKNEFRKLRRNVARRFKIKNTRGEGSGKLLEKVMILFNYNSIYLSNQ